MGKKSKFSSALIIGIKSKFNSTHIIGMFSVFSTTLVMSEVLRLFGPTHTQTCLESFQIRKLVYVRMMRKKRTSAGGDLYMRFAAKD
jgi:hypothetical protein